MVVQYNQIDVRSIYLYDRLSMHCFAISFQNGLS